MHSKCKNKLKFLQYIPPGNFHNHKKHHKSFWIYLNISNDNYPTPVLSISGGGEGLDDKAIVFLNSGGGGREGGSEIDLLWMTSAGKGSDLFLACFLSLGGGGGGFFILGGSGGPLPLGDILSCDCRESWWLVEEFMAKFGWEAVIFCRFAALGTVKSKYKII